MLARRRRREEEFFVILCVSQSVCVNPQRKKHTRHERASNMMMMIKVQHSTSSIGKPHCCQPTLVLRKHPFRPSLRSRALFSSLRKQKRTSSAEKKVVTAETRTNKYDEQKRKRLNHMPWLYDIEKHKAFAMQWQKDVQEKLMELETIEFIGTDTFIADVNVNVFAERGRKIVVNNKCRIAANVYLHGPIEVGKNV